MKCVTELTHCAEKELEDMSIEEIEEGYLDVMTTFGNKVSDKAIEIFELIINFVVNKKREILYERIEND
ncbi:MAG: hypothetical protein NC225_12690 [Clostridium sp.]|nr:hypothetical protein [Clostridium sp.]MCM1459705.1 hypothetical protein [Bacteroides sp.]